MLSLRINNVIQLTLDNNDIYEITNCKPVILEGSEIAIDFDIIIAFGEKLEDMIKNVDFPNGLSTDIIDCLKANDNDDVPDLFVFQYNDACIIGFDKNSIKTFIAGNAIDLSGRGKEKFKIKLKYRKTLSVVP